VVKDSNKGNDGGKAGLHGVYWNREKERKGWLRGKSEKKKVQGINRLKLSMRNGKRERGTWNSQLDRGKRRD